MTNKNIDPTIKPANEETRISGGEGLDDATGVRLAKILSTAREREKKLEVFGDEEDSFVTALRGLKTELSISEGSKIAYPGSSTHAGVARVFGTSNVIHVDPSEAACESLKDAGYLAEVVGIEDFHPPSPLDGIVALNSYGAPTSEVIKKVIKPGGFIIANNYTHWAARLAQLPGIELTTALLPAYYADYTELLNGSDIPEGATDVTTEYLSINPGGVITPGTAAEHTVANQSPAYPDALFVFQVGE